MPWAWPLKVLQADTRRYTPIAQYTERQTRTPRKRKTESHLKPNSDTARLAAPATPVQFESSAYTEHSPAPDLTYYSDEDEAAERLMSDIG